MKRALCCLLLCATLLLALGAAALGEGTAAQDITAQAEFSPRSPKHGLKSLSDRKYTTPWETASRKNPFVQAVLPDGQACQSLYICFGKMPAAWEVQTLQGGKWVAVAAGDTRFLHAYVALEKPVSSLRIAVTDSKKTTLLINELFLFGPGEAPGFVQQWEPTPEKADLMVLVAHPDDEVLFMGGTIPYYGTVLGKKVAAVYMTSSNTTRSSELLNGLWSMGVREYPVIGPFRDSYSGNLKNGYSRWGGKEKVQAFLMETIRRLKPDVLVTHDLNGEYGHGAHRVCADAAIWCVENAGDTAAHAPSAAQYGTWEVSKLYLHLYKDNEILLDWRVPQPALSGRTPLQAAQEAYTYHVTQQNAGTGVIGEKFSVTDEGDFACNRFGLYRTLVGPDVAKDDFFENIPQ